MIRKIHKSNFRCLEVSLENTQWCNDYRRLQLAEFPVCYEAFDMNRRSDLCFAEMLNANICCVSSVHGADPLWVSWATWHQPDQPHQTDIKVGLGCNRWLLYVLQNILKDKHIQTSTNRSTERCVNVSKRKRNNDVCWCEVYMTNRRFILEVLKLKTKQTVETSEQLNRLRRTFSFIVSVIRLNPPTVQQNTNK